MAVVYCDEAGFTGNNLLDADQQFFVFGSVAIEPDDACQLVTQVAKNLPNRELKGSRLPRSPKGRRAIREVITECRKRARLTVHHKKFALAAKFFEYIFEPLIADANSIFYTIKFHRFISSLLYFWFATKDESAEQLFKDFAAMMRSLDGSKVASFFPEQGLVQQVTATPISQIATFCLIHRKTIGSEVDALRGDDQNWILDLTTAAMMSTLACWAEKIHDMEVYCDNSKPIQAQADVFQHLVNRKDRTRMSIAGRERLITFNLVQPITMVDSASTPGIQLADVIASSFAYALNHPDDMEAQQWKHSLKERLTDDNVWYDHQDVDLTAREPFVNAVVLSELVDRSVRKDNLLDGLEQVVASAYRIYPEYCRGLLPKQTHQKR